MNIHFFKDEFSVCQLPDLSQLNLAASLFFFAKTQDELSLVCPTGEVPADTLKADHGWRLFRVEGQLDFSLIGILANISRILAENNISIFAVSTFATDYLLVKAAKADEAKDALLAAGYTLC